MSGEDATGLNAPDQTNHAVFVRFFVFEAVRCEQAAPRIAAEVKSCQEGRGG
jgi:hypothetical protein